MVLLTALVWREVGRERTWEWRYSQLASFLPHQVMSAFDLLTCLLAAMCQ